jgi:NADH:ubiquinone oxidoreductase subunit B-like Fe-S oxidoreductase
MQPNFRDYSGAGYGRVVSMNLAVSQFYFAKFMTPSEEKMMALNPGKTYWTFVPSACAIKMIQRKCEHFDILTFGRETQLAAHRSGMKVLF